MNKPQTGMDSVLPPQQPAKSKKGVKRKADTTTPANSFESPYVLADPAKSAKIDPRRVSDRPVIRKFILINTNIQIHIYIFDNQFSIELYKTLTNTFSLPTMYEELDI